VRRGVGAEFRYRNPVIEDDTLYVAVSQSGETFDTLAAVDEIKRKGGAVVGIINVVGSTIARAAGAGCTACGSGDRRRVDEDVHVDAGGVRAARAASRAE
jgi:glucosamine 6-phosphate synthetase-like amidotransferase/phosphosugar isomerase protein